MSTTLSCTVYSINLKKMFRSGIAIVTSKKCQTQLNPKNVCSEVCCPCIVHLDFVNTAPKICLMAWACIKVKINVEDYDCLNWNQ